MIIMGPKKDRGSAIAHILENMKERGSSFDRMKEENEQVSHAGMKEDIRHESIDAATNAIMDAMKSGSHSDLQNSLKSFIQLVMKQQHMEE